MIVGDLAIRTAAVWCPDWPIVAFGRSPDEPVAVLHANRVVACSAQARQAGVERGLRRRESQRRCPNLIVVERDLQLEARAFEPVAAALDDLTPRVEVVRPGLIVFPTRGPSRYFGGDNSMAARCVSLVAAGLSREESSEVDVCSGQASTVRVGVADGAFAATLAARQADGSGVCVVNTAASAAFLAPLPIRVLDRPELTSVLVRLGLDTVGRFAQLDAADVVGRFGAEGRTAHRLALGLDVRPPAMADPPPDMEVVSELDPPVERVDQAAFIGKVLADEFLQRLDDRGATCATMVIAAETEHGEELIRSWRHEGALTAGAVADRVRWQLDGWLNGSSAKRPSGGLTRLSVRPDAVIAATGRQLGFWGGQTEAAVRAARVVARVQGILGPEAVQAPERRGGRSPHEQVRSVQADTVDLDRSNVDGASTPGPWPGMLPGPSPVRLHASPSVVSVFDQSGQTVTVDGRAQLSNAPCEIEIDGGRGEVITHWAGPWPLDERWWDSARHRRRARLQLVGTSGTAWLVVVEGGQWWLEATYD